MSTDKRTAARPAVLNRIAPETSWLTRRIAAIILSIWFGGILLVALSTPSALHSVNSVLTSPPESVAKAVKTLGPGLTREILYYQAGEANRVLLDVWGWAQLGFALAVVVLLLFLSNVGRAELGLSLGMMLLAVFMIFLLIPRIAQTGRLTPASAQAASADLAEKIRLMHYGFTAFELTVVALGSMLLVLLLRGRRSSNSSRRHVEEI